MVGTSEKITDVPPQPTKLERAEHELLTAASPLASPPASAPLSTAALATTPTAANANSGRQGIASTVDLGRPIAVGDAESPHDPQNDDLNLEATLTKGNDQLWSQLGNQRSSLEELEGELATLRMQVCGTASASEPEGEEPPDTDACHVVVGAPAYDVVYPSSVPATPMAPYHESDSPRPEGPHMSFAAADVAAAVPLLTTIAEKNETSVLDNPLVQPFCSQGCGSNLSISSDGYVVTRVRGSRQAVAIGSAPLQRQASGYYFEVEVRETVQGWVGGLGIGITKTVPSSLHRLPDKALSIPGTFIVGYWGCVFLDGREHSTRWRADSLAAGTRVGLLITGDGEGDFLLFSGGVPVVRVDGNTMRTAGLQDGDPMYAVVDIFAATRSARLCPCATPPPPPWE